MDNFVDSDLSDGLAGRKVMRNVLALDLVDAVIGSKPLNNVRDIE